MRSGCGGFSFSPRPRYAAGRTTLSIIWSMSGRHDHQSRHRGLPVAARRQDRARQPQRGHRPQRQRQVEPLSGAAAPGGRRAGPDHSIACRRKAAFIPRSGPGPKASRARSSAASIRCRARSGKPRSASSSALRATITATPSISACRSPLPRHSRAIRRSRSKANGPARRSAAATCSRRAMDRACAFATSRANGGRRSTTWRRPTA